MKIYTATEKSRSDCYCLRRFVAATVFDCYTVGYMYKRLIANLFCFLFHQLCDFFSFERRISHVDLAIHILQDAILLFINKRKMNIRLGIAANDELNAKKISK